MLCEKCNKNIANVYLKNNVNGNMTESYLCSACAGELYNKSYIPIINLFDSKFESDIFSMLNFNNNKLSPSLNSVTEKNVCPVCGMSFADITKSGKVGCGKCYETFKNELTPNVMRIHGTAKHTGKIPKDRSLYINAKRKIGELNIKLKKMIEEQNFEEAAVIRDEINRINSETQNIKSKEV